MNTIAGILLLLAFIALLAGCNAAAIATRVDGPLRAAGIDECAMNGLDIFIAVVCGLLLIAGALGVWSLWPVAGDSEDDEVHPL